ncbi:discoidin domain-containing protein [Paenibacillus sp. KQZ6P-2]|uniref:Discoidin domain-containing protein n=1 Tax=Paenibacillus mangrovi TaxID=2931978 RepID=A0A9X2B4Y6_9BACL|nr:discoidin domain-containing protein [Paenibacillus mangrovi]MCJ8014490.1 discoidin domain-containing protein [Paenibacillus mangrovi]
MNAKYGYLFHYLAGYNDIKGSNIAEWNSSVDSFDVNTFADQMEEAGAGYVILTLGQNSGYYNSPNSTYETLAGYSVGAKTSVRDLPLDLYNALNPKGIKLMLYLPSNAPAGDSFAANNMGLYTKNGFDWNVNSEFSDKWAQVIQTWSDRYGSKIAGWWFDGFYSWNGFDSTYAQKYSQAAKHGNPNAIISFNPGVSLQKNPQAGDYEDYISGEQGSFSIVPSGRWLDGLQWHILSHLGSTWSKPEVKYTDWAISKNIKSINQNQGVVTMDAAIYRNGSLSPGQFNQMKAIKASVRDGIDPTPPDSNNAAFGLNPSTSASFKNLVLITDGDKSDSNKFSDSYPNNGLQWIKFDLEQSYNINKIKLWHYFGDTRRYHDVIVQLSNTADFSSGVTTVFNNDADNSAVQGVGTDAEYIETSSGKDITFPNVNARYVRLWSNGSTANGSNHYVEVEIYKASSTPTKVDDPYLTYTGKWSTSGFSSGYYNDTDHFTTTAGSTAEYTFNGTSVAWFGVKGSDHGKADVYIDDVLDSTIDLYQETRSVQSLIYTKTGLPNGVHSIKIVVRSDRNPSASNNYVEVDYLEYADKGEIDQTPPSDATFVADVTVPTNTDVVVTINYPDDAVVKEYKVGEDGEWTPYTGPLVLSDNNKVYARGTDAAGNVSNITSYEISNIDKTAPTLSVQLDQASLWPANHKMVTVNATLDANDAESGVASVVLTSITSNEPDSWQGDIQARIGTEDTSFQLRAERLGQGSGRIYTITYTVTDKAGNTAVATATVTVPHDQSGKSE